MAVSGYKILVKYITEVESIFLGIISMLSSPDDEIPPMRMLQWNGGIEGRSLSRKSSSVW
ncbi:hypothetical protein POUND7_007894 [Theobroma cacao]